RKATLFIIRFRGTRTSVRYERMQERATTISPTRACQAQRCLRMYFHLVRPGGLWGWTRRRRCLQTGPSGAEGRTTESSRLTPRLLMFTRPPADGKYDAQRGFEHEMDEVIGLGSYLNISGDGDLQPQDLFSWSSAGNRNTSSSGTRFFSINGGVTNIVNFNQGPTGDFGDWLSAECPQSHPYVQNAFSCTGQFSDVTATSPEGINLDVIGYDLVIPSTPTPTPTPTLDPCFPNFTTAEGCDALSSLTIGAGNTALGWRSLFLTTTGSFNTGVGGGALALNNGNSNTAAEVAALLLNTSGAQNTAVGTN